MVEYCRNIPGGWNRPLYQALALVDCVSRIHFRKDTPSETWAVSLFKQRAAGMHERPRRSQQQSALCDRTRACAAHLVATFVEVSI